jgi:putative oxidoreductase
MLSRFGELIDLVDKFKNIENSLLLRKSMQNGKNIGLFILRVGICSLMMVHGFHKIEKFLSSGEAVKFYDFIRLGPKISLILAILGEFIAPIFVIVGFKSKWALIPMIITMLVAVFGAHAGEPFSEREHALLYLIVLVVLYLTGDGKYSLEKSKTSKPE